MAVASLDPGVLDVFERLYSVERAKWDDDFSREVSKTTSKLSSHGLLQSSVAVRQFVDLGVAAISVRASVALTLVLRCLRAHGTLISSEMVQPTVDLLAKYIETETSKIREFLGKAPSMRGSMQEHALKALPRLDEAAAREVTRITGEVQLLAAAAAAQPPATTSSQPITIHGPVGLVQTGAGSFGMAVQHLDQGASEAIRKALDQIAEALRDVGLEAPFNAADVTEMIEESRSELDKPKPNLPKLTAVLTGIGNTIAFAPKLRAAYETLKWALSFVGVTLPG